MKRGREIIRDDDEEEDDSSVSEEERIAAAPPPRLDDSDDDGKRSSRKKKKKNKNKKKKKRTASASSDEDEDDRRAHMTRRLESVTLGINEGQGGIDLPEIRELDVIPDSRSGYIRNRAGEIMIRDGKGGFKIGDASEVAKLPPYDAELFVQRWKRREMWHQHPDYKFAVILAAALNKDIEFVLDDGEVSNFDRADEAFREARLAALKTLDRNLGAKSDELDKLRRTENEFRQEENLIQSGITGPIRLWWESHHIRDWLQILGNEDATVSTGWLMPFYYRWRYRWMRDMMQPGFILRADDLVKVQRMMTIDATIFKLDSLPEPYEQVVELLNDPDRLTTYLHRIEDADSAGERTNTSRYLVYMIFTYMRIVDYVLRDRSIDHKKQVDDDVFYTNGHWLTDVLTHHIRLGSQHLPGFTSAAAAGKEILRTYDETNADGYPPVLFADLAASVTTGSAVSLFNADYVRLARQGGYLTSDLDDNEVIWFPDDVFKRDEQYVRTALRQFSNNPPPIGKALTAKLAMYVDRLIMGTLDTATDPIDAGLWFHHGYDPERTQDSNEELQRTQRYRGQEFFMSRRRWFPWLEDYELACRLLVNAAGGIVLDLLESLFPNPDNTDATAVNAAAFSLIALPRTLAARSNNTYADKNASSRLLYFRSDPTAGESAGALAIGDIQDYYHYTAAALRRPAANVYAWDPPPVPPPTATVLAMRGVLRRPILDDVSLQRFRPWYWDWLGQSLAVEMAAKFIPNAAAAASLDIRGINATVVAERLLPALLPPPNVPAPPPAPPDDLRGGHDAEVSTHWDPRVYHAAHVLADFLAQSARRYNPATGLFLPFPIRMVTDAAKNPVELAVVQALTQSSVLDMSTYMAQSDFVKAEGFLGAWDSASLVSWLGENAPLALMALLLDEIVVAYTAGATSRAERGKRVRVTITNLETALQQLSAKQQEDATLQVGTDMRTSLLSMIQKLSVPTMPSAADPDLTGYRFFTVYAEGLIQEGSEYVHGTLGYPDVPLSDLTNRDDYPTLSRAFCDFLAALAMRRGMEHANVYKTQVEDRRQTPTMIRTRQALRVALEKFQRDGGGTRLQQVFASGTRARFTIL